MLSLEDFKTIISDLIDELPDEFFKELSGGVIVSESSLIPGYAREDDLYTLGQYRVYHGMRQIVIYKGSFDRVHPSAGITEARRILRGILRHEVRHHMESLGGVHDSSSLEAYDEREKQAYLSRHDSSSEK